MPEIVDGVPEAVSTSVLTHLLTVGSFVLAVFAIARLMSEKRQPSNTMAWLLVIVLVPYVGVPLYLLLGGRKLRKLMERKSRSMPRFHLEPRSVSPLPHASVAQTVTHSGAQSPIAGNRVRFLSTGETAFRELTGQIQQARHSIHILTFILGRDETGRELIELLAEKARQGVKVRLLLDAVGSLFSSGSFCDPLRKAGGEVVRFLPVLPLSSRASANLRNHRKIAVFDHCTALIGGHNLAREYMGREPWRKRWSDFGAVIEGPGAELLDEVFLADWAFAANQSFAILQRKQQACRSTDLPGDSVVQVVASGPDVKGDPLYEGILTMIQEAKESIWIVTPYFIPDEVLLRSLMVKARAGRDVTLILPARSNHPVTDFARRHYVRELQAAGAWVRFYGPGMLHSKATIVDRSIAMVGSANFDLRSLFVNFEIGLFLYTRSDVLEMHAWAEQLLARSHAPSDRRRKRNRLLGHLAEDLSRLLAPLL